VNGIAVNGIAVNGIATLCTGRTTLDIVKDVVKLFPSIHSSRHPSMDGITAAHVVKILLYT
jgi:hypothetical protein